MVQQILQFVVVGLKVKSVVGLLKPINFVFITITKRINRSLNENQFVLTK